MILARARAAVAAVAAVATTASLIAGCSSTPSGPRPAPLPELTAAKAVRVL